MKEEQGKTGGQDSSAGVTQRYMLFRRITASSPFSFILLAGLLLLYAKGAVAEPLALQPLLDEALKNSPEIKAAESRAAASQFRIPQAKSLPDPMVMFGYQNEGTNKITFNEMQDSQFMFSASQMFPFPGKRELKGEMAARDAESQTASYRAAQLKTVARVKELYYDLFLSYKNLDLIKDRVALFSRLEDAALARYSSGTGMQQDVLMAQTEKYMLLEKEEMLRQKIQSTEAMLNAVVGRDATAPLGRPGEPGYTPFGREMSELLTVAFDRSPEIKTREKMVAAAEVKIRMAKKEYYPDFTLTGNYGLRGREFPDMWSFTTAINIPLYYKTKQKQAVHEAEASLMETRNELEAAKLMLSSGIRDNYWMVKAAERLMELYQNGLIPKTYQDFEAVLAGYTTGKSDALTVISRLRAIIEIENSYWVQMAEKEKAKARIEALTGTLDTGPGASTK